MEDDAKKEDKDMEVNDKDVPSEGKQKVFPPRPSTARGKRTPAGGCQGDEEDKTSSSKTSQENPGNSSIVEEDGMLSHGRFDAAPSRLNEGACNQPSTSRGGYGGQSSKRGGRSYVEQVSREELQIGEQARLLLNLFIQERVENTSVEPIIRDVCQADKQALIRSGIPDEQLSDIALTLRRIGDDISQNVELNNFIEKVPLESTRDIFMKVCFQIFQDGNLNWGRVVALFYFAYKLVLRTVTHGMDSVPWIRDMLSWAVEFIVKNVAKWILRVGGWQMIKDYMGGVSSQTWVALSFVSLAVILWALFKKN